MHHIDVEDPSRHGAPTPSALQLVCDPCDLPPFIFLTQLEKTVKFAAVEQLVQEVAVFGRLVFTLTHPEGEVQFWEYTADGDRDMALKRIISALYCCVRRHLLDRSC